MTFSLHLSQFEGPLDLLLFLIGKAKVDIKDIFVSEVTQQYISFVENAPDLDMDDASGFLAMAATLLEIKSRALLPKQKEETGEEEDPEKELIRRLEEYQALKTLAVDMVQFERAAAQMFEKLPDEFPLPPPQFELKNLTMEGLMEAFARIFARARDDSGEEHGRPLGRIVRDEYSIPGCMAGILRKVRTGPVSFLDLLHEIPSRDEVVTNFLAVLELLKLGKISASQSGIYGDITLSARSPEKDDQSGEKEEPDT